MKRRFYVQVSAGTMKIYADTEDEARKMFPDAIDIQPCYDTDYLKYVEIIKSECKNVGSGNFRETYETTKNGNLITVVLAEDEEGDYLDVAFYQVRHKTDMIVPITFTLSNPKDVAERFFIQKEATYFVHSKRKYGEPKLKKPKELANIKQICSIRYNKKCMFPVFVKGNDVWIKSKDYFSPSFIPPDPKDHATPLTYRLKKYFKTDKGYLDKFVYSDCWGDIVLRSEAWLCFTDIMTVINENPYNAAKVMYDLMKKTDENMRNYTHDESAFNNWKWFYEELCKTLGEYCNGK